VCIHTEGNPVQIETSPHWNLIGHCLVELSTGTTLSYIFLVTIYNLRRTQDMCLNLRNSKTVPLLISHTRYKVLHSKSQGQMHYILCRALKYVYIRQAVVITQAWAFFSKCIWIRIPAKYLKVMTPSGAEKKFLIMFLFYSSFSYFRFMNT